MSTVTCTTCPHACTLEQGELGICGARVAGERAVVPLGYGCATALALDPIEKKPLARFYPGSKILSYGSFGCNLSCNFCQNWQIAQAGKPSAAKRARASLIASEAKPPPFSPLSPEELLKRAEHLRARGNIGIALTYNEPLVCPEYCLDLAERAHERDFVVVLVTNGYVTSETARQIFSRVDAVNIDLKAFRQDFYTVCGAPVGLSTVKRSIQLALEAGCHVEISTLIIPALNDSLEEMAEEAAWLASLSPRIPLHINRFFPSYQMMSHPPTPASTMYDLVRIAKKQLAFVYPGNI